MNELAAFITVLAVLAIVCGLISIGCLVLVLAL